jgi:flagellar motor protein MotB
VRIASVEGLIVETDQYGRYHLIGIDAGQSARGRNFILKVDAATLAPGSEFTTENPKVRRITGGVPTRFDFGVRMPEEPIRGSRLVEMEIGTVMFEPGSSRVQPRYLPVVDSMVGQVHDHGGGEVVITADGETEALAFARANAVRELVDQRLDEALRGTVTLSVRAQADDPATLIAGIGEGGPVLGTLLFDTDRSTIQPRFDALLDEIAELLASSGGSTVTIIGHADRRGSREYNAALGLRRATAVYEALENRLPPEARARLTVETRADPGASTTEVVP